MVCLFNKKSYVNRKGLMYGGSQQMKKRYIAAMALLASVSVTGCESPISTGAGAQSSSGQVQGVTKTQVLVGTSGPLTGPVAPYGAVTEGVNAYFNYINGKGGVNGRKIKLMMLDDQYLPQKAASNARQLVADKVFATVGTLGTACNEAMDPILEKAGIPITVRVRSESERKGKVIPF